MNRSSFLGAFDVVSDPYLNRIAPVCFDEWPWELMVYEHYAFIKAVSRMKSSRDGEVVGACNASIRRGGSSSSDIAPRGTIW